jgi:hypothetical protein
MYQQISQHFGQRGQVEALVMTSFGLDVSYFERYILPAFFPSLGEGPVSEPHRPLFEYLEENQIPISVLFDANQLQRGEQLLAAGSSVIKELRWQAHPEMPRAGFFHPKVIIALLNDNGEKSLVVGAASANLTRSGWAHNFESCALVDLQLRAASKSSLLVDVRELLQSFQEDADNSVAIKIILEHIHECQAVRHSTRKHANHYRTRLWFGQDGLNLTDWLSQQVLHSDLRTGEWHLDVLSPYYSDDIPSLIDWANRQLNISSDTSLRTDAIRCYCPKLDGQYDIEHSVLEMYESSGVTWSSLVGETLKSKKKNTDGHHLERYLHAKVFRFWSKHNEVVIIGSANATKQGLRDGGHGNNEASLVLSSTAAEGAQLSSWLKPIAAIEKEDCNPVSEAEDHSVEEEKVPELMATFDWASAQLVLHNRDHRDVEIYLGNHAQANWVLQPGNRLSQTLEGLLIGSLFKSPTLKVKRISNSDKAWLCLVSESNLHAKPPAPSMERTIDELIRDWQLGPVERFTERVGLAGLPDDSHYMTAYTEETIESLPIEDRLNDMFLAMAKFRKEIESRLESEDELSEFNVMQIKARLFGHGAMSVKYFAEKLHESIDIKGQGQDGLSPTEGYISMLSVLDTLQLIKSKLSTHDLNHACSELIFELHDNYLNKIRERVKRELERDKDAPEPTQLINWVEQHFSYHGNQFNGQY